jgi:hypothetical protein
MTCSRGRAMAYTVRRDSPSRFTPVLGPPAVSYFRRHLIERRREVSCCGRSLAPRTVRSSATRLAYGPLAGPPRSPATPSATRPTRPLATAIRIRSPTKHRPMQRDAAVDDAQVLLCKLRSTDPPEVRVTRSSSRCVIAFCHRLGGGRIPTCHSSGGENPVGHESIGDRLKCPSVGTLSEDPFVTSTGKAGAARRRSPRARLACSALPLGG